MQLHVTFILFCAVLTLATPSPAQNIGEKTQTSKNTKKSSYFITFRTPPYQRRSLKKIKTIGHASSCNTLIILCSSNISHFLTCRKTKRPKILKIKLFL